MENFLQRPGDHINNKQNCPKCSNAGYSQISIQFLNDFSREWKVEIQHAVNIEFMILSLNAITKLMVISCRAIKNILLSSMVTIFMAIQRSINLMEYASLGE